MIDIKKVITQKNNNKNKKNKMKPLKRYTVWTCLILIISSLVIIIHEVNALVEDYQESMPLIDDYFVRKSTLKAPKPALAEELNEESIIYSFESSKSLVIPETKETEIKRKIKEVFGEKFEEAELICGCESEYNPTVWGDTTTEFKSVGLFQIRELKQRMELYNLTTDKLENIDENIKMAKIIYDRAGGWSPWLNCANKHNLLKK